jgi:uncharacterized protein with PIN domain
MKPLTKDQLTGLLGLVDATRDQELTCRECQDYAAEFAERQLAGAELDSTLKKVEQHLEVCPECREELLALKKVLEAGG